MSTTLQSAAGGGGMSIPPSPARRKECRFFAEGRCQNGSKCPWLHRISIKRPSGWRGGQNIETALSQGEPHSSDSEIRLRRKAVDRSEPSQEYLNLQGQSQVDRNHQPQADIRVQQQNEQAVSLTVQHGSEGGITRRANANICFEWEKTKSCARGTNCWYRHDVNDETGQVSKTDAPSESSHDSVDIKVNDDEETRRKKLKAEPCFRFPRGKCFKGDSCWYSHDVEVTMKAKDRMQREAEERKKELEEEERKRKEQDLWEAELARVRREVEECVQQQAEDRQRKRVAELSRRLEEERRNAEQTEARRHQQVERQQIRQGKQEALKRALEEEKMRNEAEWKRMEAERKVKAEQWKRREEERKQKEEEWKKREENRKRQEEERKRKQEEWKEREERRKQRQEARLEEEKRAEERRQRDARISQQEIIGQNNLVTFAAGLQIEHLIPGFDLSSILIHDLPKTATDKEIMGLFRDQGMDDKECKLVSRKHGGDTQTAKILVRTEAAQVLAVGLGDLQFQDQAIRVETSQGVVRGAMSSFSDARATRTLSIAWRLPSASMVALYGTVEEARMKVADVNGLILRDRKISAIMNPVPTGSAARFWVEASIKVGNLSPQTEAHEVQAVAQASSVRPIKSFVYDNDSFLAQVKGLLEREGCDPKTFQSTIQDHNMLRLTVEFSARESLEAAGASLGSGVLGPSSPKLFVIVPKAHQYSIVISTSQYQAQKGQWGAMTESAKGRGAFIRLKEARGSNAKTYVYLQGSDEREVGMMKVRVEGLVAGEALEGTEYWHTGFLRTDGNLFKQAFEQTGAWITVDTRGQTLRAFGTNSSIAMAKELVRAEVNRLASMEREFTVPRRYVRFFVEKGLDALREAIGEDKVAMDVSGPECTLRVRGGDDAAKCVSEVMSKAASSWNDVPSAGQKSDAEAGLCPICYDIPSLPESLVCGHSCCSACLRHYLTSVSSFNDFPLVCLGDDATCKTPISIPVIKRYLTDQQFARLLDVAFTSYIQLNRQNFKYCTTPDCSMIYRCDTDQKFHRCPSCFATICSSCDKEAHEGMTCEERRIQGDPSEQERLNEEWAKANNAQRCPGSSCGVLTEKVSGCNHMTCVGCNAHWCWLCRGVFPSEEVYPHLTAVHGGFGL